ncbi:MAG: peptidase renal dipeptidase [Pseudonocardia sp.]|uniref:dipeptidase n=1 Tax=Pseudonocardia sp. TaxID=60912 RepID=UPI00262A26BD|nr:membrane dipeptidase [Pseudonocardia sp.]MCU1626890.1 peptidase renal dipeptidase [Pseudonocardia sp.]MDT7699387.1 rane dipeptidase [Pseudonocardiales bacterium]
MPTTDIPLVADAHNDLLMLVARRPRDRWSTYFREHWYPQLRDGGVKLQVLPVFVDEEFRPEGALRESLRMVEAAHRIAEANADIVALCCNGPEIAAAIASGRIALVLALEGCPQIDTDIELLETFVRLGIRIVSFTHFGRSALGDGSAENGTGGRLTRAGVDALHLLEDLNVLIDVSHLGRAGVGHVLELATRPLIATHSAAHRVHPHHRNLTDDELVGIAATGGAVCLNLYAGYLTSEQPALHHVADHLDHLIQTVGPDHVGIGSDFVAELFAEKVPACDRPLVIEGTDAEALVPGLEGPAGLPLIRRILLERDHSHSVVRSILGDNLVQLFTKTLSYPTAANRHRCVNPRHYGR